MSSFMRAYLNSVFILHLAVLPRKLYPRQTPSSGGDAPASNGISQAPPREEGGVQCMKSLQKAYLNYFHWREKFRTLNHEAD